MWIFVKCGKKIFLSFFTFFVKGILGKVLYKCIFFFFVIISSFLYLENSPPSGDLLMLIYMFFNPILLE